MKRKISLRLSLCLIGLLVMGAACNSMRNWEQFESQDGWFRILFPGSPDKEKESMNTPLGTIDIYMYMVELKNGAYLAGYFDYPPEVAEKLESDEMLVNMVNGGFRNIGGRVESKEFIDFEGYQGVEAEGSFRRGGVSGVARFRCIVVEERIYMLQVLGFESFVNSSDSDKFFNSFGLIYEDE